MREAVVVDAVRTPFGRAGERGIFRDITAVELVSTAVQALLKRTKIDPNEIEEFIFGTVLLPGFFARNLVFELGLPEKIGSVQCCRQCASSLHALAEAAAFVQNGTFDVVLVGGAETDGRIGPAGPDSERGSGVGADFDLESMEKRPGATPDGWKDAEILPRFYKVVPGWIWNMGLTAEALSVRYGVTREQADLYALKSQQKAAAAFQTGRFKDHVVPVTINYKDGSKVTIEQDQGMRADTTLEKLSALRPAFREGGVCTAGNCCPRNDGAAAALIMTKEKAKELGYKPLVTLRAAAMVGVDPQVMGIGPWPATEKLLKKMKMTISNFDLVELNEAFACQCAFLQHQLKIPEEKLNVNGGAVALGHPFGATGIRLVAQVGNELKRRNLEWGLTTLCLGGGQGMAMAVQRENYS